MNNVTLVGRLTKDPELKYVGEGQTPVAEFTIAIKRSYKSNQKNVDFIPIQVWDKQAENCNIYLQKGDLVGINGEIRVDKYVNKQGENKYITKVRATTVKFLSKAKRDISEQSSDKKYYDSSTVFTNNGIDVDSEKIELPF